MLSKNLVITADVFGYGLERNRGIVECFLEGAVTRASLLVNGVACSDAFDLAQKHHIPVGKEFHLHAKFYSKLILILAQLVKLTLYLSASYLYWKI